MTEMACENYLDNIHEMVKSKFSSAEEYAEDAWDVATSYLDEVSAAANSFDFTFPILFTWADLNVNDHTPVMPDRPDMNVELPDSPLDPVLKEVLVDPVDVPSFDVVSPTITIPDAPSVNWPSDPGESPSIVYPDMPTKASYDLPDVPTIEDVVIPTAPETEIPSFEGELPVDDVDLPQSIFIYNEAVYDSALRTAVSNKLLEDVQNGGTGLAEDVEDAIWERARARLELEKERKYEDVEDHFAARGFNIPQGALDNALMEIIKENARADEQINYEVMIEQARLAQTNTHFTLTSAIQQEANIMAFVSGVAGRALEAVKYSQEAAIAIFNASVAKYNQKLLTYQACAVVYESRIRAAGLILENYKAKLEGVKIVVEVQGLYVDIYRAQVSAVETLVNLYKTEMEAARIQGDIERIKLDAFRSKIEAYNAKLQAITSRYNAYQAHIAGEGAKAAVYDTQVKGYLGRVEGVKTEASINIAEATAKIESNRNLIEAYRADIAKYEAIAGALLGELETNGRVYGYDVGAYEADVKLAGVKIEGDISSYRAKVESNRSWMEQQLAEVEMRLNAALKLHEVQVEALKSGSNVTAQMAASALASVAAGAQLSYRGMYDRSDQNVEYRSGSI